MLNSARSEQAQYSEVECIYLDVDAQALSYKGRVTTLSKLQWEILHALLRVPEATVSSESLRALLDERSSDALGDGALTVHIHHLRRKLTRATRLASPKPRRRRLLSHLRSTA